jgi:hypothetical protein
LGSREVAAQLEAAERYWERRKSAERL